MGATDDHVRVVDDRGQGGPRPTGVRALRLRTVHRPDRVELIGGARQDLVGPTVLPVNTWTHVAITYDNLTLRLYVNGIQVATRAQTGPTATSTGALRLGGSAAWGEYLNGSLDDVRIYSRALPVAQIRIDRTTPVA